jgi:hypothetical protein
MALMETILRLIRAIREIRHHRRVYRAYESYYLAHGITPLPEWVEADMKRHKARG